MVKPTFNINAATMRRFFGNPARRIFHPSVLKRPTAGDNRLDGFLPLMDPPNFAENMLGAGTENSNPLGKMNIPFKMSPVCTEGNNTKENRGIILIVDDEVDIHPVLDEFLGSEGYEVISAYSGEEAKEIIQKMGEKIDIVIADIYMEHEKSGIDVLNLAMSANPEMAVIIMTAYSSEEVAIEALRGRAVEYLAKPLEFEGLVNKVNMLRGCQILEKQRRALEIREAELRIAERLIGSLMDYFSQGSSAKQLILHSLLEEITDSAPREDLESLGEVFGREGKMIAWMRDLIRPTRLNLSKIDISQVLKRAISDLRREYLPRIQFNYQSGLPEALLDKEIIKKAFTFFLDYAAEASVRAKDEGRESCVNIEVATRDNGLEVKIADNGKRNEDFNLEVLRSIPFVHGKTFFYESHVRLHLGLKFIEAHNGTIEIEGDKDSGITVSIWLPLDLTDRGNS